MILRVILRLVSFPERILFKKKKDDVVERIYQNSHIL